LKQIIKDQGYLFVISEAKLEHVKFWCCYDKALDKSRLYLDDNPTSTRYASSVFKA